MMMAAVNRPKGGAGARRRERARLHLDVIELIVQVAHVLTHGEDVVEAVLEFVAERRLLVFQALIVEVAGKEIPWNLPESAGYQRALDRQQRKRSPPFGSCR